MNSSDSIASPELVSVSSRRVEAPKIEHFIGRRSHMRMLHGAFTTLLEERPVIVYVHGYAGMGKSTLIHNFLMGLRHGEGAVVLRGRCLEGDSAPYNAFGSVVGALSRYLRRLPKAEITALLPRDIHVLARLFPTLQHVDAITESPHSQNPIPDVQELRRRGFAALRHIFWRLAERRPLVVSIEDLQWSDMDSITLLVDLLRPPAAPAMLFIGSYRTNEVENSLPLTTLLAQSEALKDGTDVRELEVGPLEFIEAEELVLALLFARDPDSRAHADAIARASEGNPRVIGELVRALQSSPSEQGGKATEMALTQALRLRLARLPQQALRLLDVIAVAGSPVDPTVLVQAAKLAPDEQAPALALLRTEDLVIARRSAGRDTFEILHDSIRQAILARLEPAQVQTIHRRLARVLEAQSGADSELLSSYWRGAGNTYRAAHFAIMAADEAADALAFERAARLYELALGLLPATKDPPSDPSPNEDIPLPERRMLAVRCADSLVNAGKSAQAAKVYESAVEGAENLQSLELRRRAAEQYLRSGHIDEGLALLRSVLRSLRLTFPKTSRRALISLLLRRALLRLRGVDFRERTENEISPKDLARIDACWSVTLGLSGVDMIRSADFSTRTLLFALRAGEPYRIARVLAVEVSTTAMLGGHKRAQAEALLSKLRVLNKRVDNPHAFGLCMMVSGILEAFAAGRWKAALGWYQKAEDVFRDRCTGVAWEIVTTQLLTCWVRFYRGQMKAMANTLPSILRQADQRGDLYAVAILCVAAAWVALAADDVNRARRQINSAMEGWSSAGFHLEHHSALLAQGYVDRYAGRAGIAWKRFEAQWDLLEASLLLRVQNNRIMAHIERGSTAIAAAEDSANPEPLIQAALHDANALMRENMPWAKAFGVLLQAGATAVQGDQEKATSLLSKAAAEFDAVDMGLYAAAARRREGELCGGEKGLQLILVADAFMTRENIKNPRRWAEMLAPGFGKHSSTFVHHLDDQPSKEE